jgi:glutaredoxin 3
MMPISVRYIMTVTLFSLGKCPECVHVKKMFEELGIDFKEVDISDDAYRAKVVEKTGHYSVPQVMMGERYIGDYRVIVDLYKSKKLKETMI